MSVFCVDVALRIFSDSLSKEVISDKVNQALDQLWTDKSFDNLIFDNVQVEENQSGYRVLDADGQWHEPSKDFLETIRSTEKALSKDNKHTVKENGE